MNVKYRTLDKRFRQVKGADKILYGLDDAVGQDTIIIVEGKPQRSRVHNCSMCCSARDESCTWLTVCCW